MGSFRFVVETTRGDDRLLVESLFHDLPEPSARVEDATSYSLTRQGDDGGSWAVRGPHLFEWPGAPLPVALGRLVAAVNLSALDADPEHLHLHAAAACRDQRAVILAGARGVGKTTAVAHLVKRGWGFVTDETVRLPRGGERISGFPKPLSIKPTGRALVDHLESRMIPSAADGDDGTRFIPMGASGATIVDGGVPHLVLLLRHPRGERSAPEARRLDPTDAVVSLMQETLDATRFGPAAHRLATLAAASHCYELTLGEPSDTAQTIERLFETDPPDPLDVSVLPRSDSFTSGVVSLTIGDRAVVHDEASGHVLALDAGGTRVWKQLSGHRSEPEIDLEGPVVRQFVAQLRDLGVVTV